MSTSIDVVVPTYNGWELTERCLRHLGAQTVPHSVFVVDNGSTDGTPEKVRAAFPRAAVVELGANLGFPVACNRGAAAGARDVVVLLNNDVEARPDFLEQLVRPLEKEDRVGSVAALLLQPGELVVDSVGLTVDRTLAGFPRLRGRRTGDADSPAPVLTGPVGGGGAYRRAAWEEVGGLDEGVRFYGEDVDLALRLRAAGWKTASAPQAIAVHLGSATAGKRSAQQRFEAGFARGYFLRRYGVLRGSLAVRTLATESIVVAGDAVLNRDLSALAGRLKGWQAGGMVERLPQPPADAVDPTISFWESLRLRRAVYAA